MCLFFYVVYLITADPLAINKKLIATAITINNREVGKITKQIKMAFEEIVRGKNQKFSEWLTPVD